MQSKKVLIIGEIYLDTHLDKICDEGPLFRLGGIFHSARAFSALGVDFSMAYYAPDYLEADICKFSKKLNAKENIKIGSVNKAPNIMLINESKEVADQGYCNLLRAQATFYSTKDIINVINEVNPTDILINPGGYDTRELLNTLGAFKGRIHIDMHYDSENLLEKYSGPIETVILSTSSSIFKLECNQTIEGALEFFKQNTIRKILIKENRGGSYCYNLADENVSEAPAYHVNTMHSVGVGDVFNSIFISNMYEDNIEKRMRLASYISAHYAQTMDFDVFEKNVQLILKEPNTFISLNGIRLSWEKRKNKHIYIAAPDFPHIDTTILEQLKTVLEHHNFFPRFPIKENGLVDKNMSFNEKLSIYEKDIELLNECELLIAILLYNDPGTLVELGIFKQMNKPVIIFDPLSICDNNFVIYTADFISSSIDGILSAVYNFLGEDL